MIALIVEALLVVGQDVGLVVLVLSHDDAGAVALEMPPELLLGGPAGGSLGVSAGDFVTAGHFKDSVQSQVTPEGC